MAAGKFSKRELTLIDYLEKTKASGAISFFVKSKNGIMMVCKNKVDHEGTIVSSDGKMLKMDVEEIVVAKRVSTADHVGKVIYTKKEF